MYVDPKLVPSRTLANGCKIPCLGLGTFGSDRYDAQTIASAVEGAIHSGYRLIDCTSCYGNEAEIGEVLARVEAQGVVKREELFIISKLWNDKHAKNEVLLSCAQTLHDLRLEYLDAYFVHWPFRNYHAPHCDGDSRNPDSTPFSLEKFMETWRRFERLYTMGLVRNLGMSNMTIPKLEAVLPLCKIRPTMIELELHPSFQQPELFAYLQAHKIQPVGFCPIGSPRRPDRDVFAGDVVDTQMPSVVAAARAHGVHPAAICLKWSAQRGAIPIPFSTTPEHYVENLRCVTQDPLSQAEIDAIAQDDRNCRLVKGQVFLWPGATDWRDLWDIHGEITR